MGVSGATSADSEERPSSGDGPVSARPDPRFGPTAPALLAVPTPAAQAAAAAGAAPAGGAPRAVLAPGAAARGASRAAGGGGASPVPAVEAAAGAAATAAPEEAVKCAAGGSGVCWPCVWLRRGARPLRMDFCEGRAGVAAAVGHSPPPNAQPSRQATSRRCAWPNAQAGPRDHAQGWRAARSFPRARRPDPRPPLRSTYPPAHSALHAGPPRPRPPPPPQPQPTVGCSERRLSRLRLPPARLDSPPPAAASRSARASASSAAAAAAPAAPGGGPAFRMASSREEPPFRMPVSDTAEARRGAEADAEPEREAGLRAPRSELCGGGGHAGAERAEGVGVGVVGSWGG